LLAFVIPENACANNVQKLNLIIIIKVMKFYC